MHRYRKLYTSLAPMWQVTMSLRVHYPYKGDKRSRTHRLTFHVLWELSHDCSLSLVTFCSLRSWSEVLNLFSLSCHESIPLSKSKFPLVTAQAERAGKQGAVPAEAKQSEPDLWPWAGTHLQARVYQQVSVYLSDFGVFNHPAHNKRLLLLVQWSPFGLKFKNWS